MFIKKSILSLGILGLLLVGCGDEAENTDSTGVSAGYMSTTNTFSVNNSNLMWQDDKVVEDNKQFYRDINAYCSNLELDTYTNWRVPTKSEYREDLYPYKENLHFSWSLGNYIFWTSIATYGSIIMYNLSNDRVPIYKEETINDYAWGLRCVRDIE